MAKIAIIGVGYVGLCTAAGFSKLGHRVKCFDLDERKIESLQKNQIPIYEEGLQALVSEGQKRGNLSFHFNLSDVLTDSDFIFICVPTPQDEDGTADLSYVVRAAKNIAPYLLDGATVVVKSTVPVGAASTIIESMNRLGIHYVSNPEFLREGTAIWDFFNPERIVVGSTSVEASLAVADLYGQTDVPIIATTTSSAELIKYAANSFLALKLSFVNEVAHICEKTGADIQDVTKGFGLDSRIGEKFLHPGPGWGGSCFPKDTRALLSTSKSVGAPSQLIDAAIAANNVTFNRMVDRLASTIGSLEGKNIGVWGIAFKANTDDTRDSPALEIVNRLIEAGSKVVVYDPVAVLPSRYDNVIQVHTPAEAVQDKDALLVLTEWPEFHLLDAENLVSTMQSRVVFDARRILNESWSSECDLILVGR